MRGSDIYWSVVLVASCVQPRPQGLLGIFQNGGSLLLTHDIEKYPEGPKDEVELRGTPAYFLLLPFQSSQV